MHFEPSNNVCTSPLCLNQVDRCRSMIRSWDNGTGDGGTTAERGSQEESPLPPPTAAGERGESAVCEGPLLSALLNKTETLLDQVSGPPACCHELFNINCLLHLLSRTSPTFFLPQYSPQSLLCHTQWSTGFVLPPYPQTAQEIFTPP